MKETALLHSMAMLLQDMLERNEISHTIFKKRINEMDNHVTSRIKEFEEQKEYFEKLKRTLEELYFQEVNVKPLSY